MIELDAIQIRVLGCLIEKASTTPEQYPLTLNALKTACNQKTSRFPVTQYSEGEIGHALRDLEALDLVHEDWGARAHKYRHRFGKVMELHSKSVALLATLMLRGPQTPGELKTHSHRLFAFDDLDDVQFALSRLEQSDPPLVCSLPRQPGQKEERYAHLLSGQPDPELFQIQAAAPAHAAPSAEMDQRLQQIEEKLRALSQRIEAIEANQ